MRDETLLRKLSKLFSSDIVAKNIHDFRIGLLGESVNTIMEELKYVTSMNYDEIMDGHSQTSYDIVIR